MRILYLLSIFFFMVSCGDIKNLNDVDEILQNNKESDKKDDDDNDLAFVTAEQAVLVKRGIFVDGAVQGIVYMTATRTGTTNQNGTFEYLPGETVTFTMGGVTLGSVAGQSRVTPITVTGASDESDQRVINMIRFLQSLDDDGNHANGINITTATKTALAGVSLDFNQSVSAFETAVASSISTFTASNSNPQTTLKDTAEALQNFKEVLSSSGIATVNTAPQEITLSTTGVAEMTSSGTTFATLASTNANDGTALNDFTLVSQSLVGAFQISGNQLQIADSHAIDFENSNSNSNSISVKVTDADGLTLTQTLTVTVTDANDTPTDISLSSTSVSENQASGTAVGTLSTTDADSSDSHTYSLVSGTGDTNNSSFSTSSSSLLTAATFDFETQSSYSIRVRTTDASSATYEEVFTITVTENNTTPTDISLSATSIAENESSGTTVGTLSCTDADSGDSASFSLVSGTGDTNNSSFSISSASLLTAASFDFETMSSYSIRIRCTDGGSATYEEVFTITVTDVNETPTDIALSSGINENEASNTTVGSFTTTDPDSSDTASYSLISGTGSDDNSLFSISSNSLISSTTFDYEVASTRSILVRVTDSGGATYDEAISVTINDYQVQQAYLKAPNAGSGDSFANVAIDSDTIVIGASGEDSAQTTITNGTTVASDDDTTDVGAVYVFKRSGTTWSQEAYLKPVNATSNDFFGTSIAIDGDTIVVGASNDDSAQTTITNGTTTASNFGNNGSGAAYVYKRSGTSWSQEAYLKAPNAGKDDRFGATIAIDGDTIVVGADSEDSVQTTITNGTTAPSDNGALSVGAAYVFRRSGTTWSQEAYLKAPNAEGVDTFGTSVAINGDTIVVGAFQESSAQTTITNGTTAASDNGAGAAGAAYVFKRSGTSWSQEAYLKAPNAGITDSFGSAVAIDGDTIVVGATSEDSAQTTITNGTTAASDDGTSDSGAVYVFKRSGTIWSQEAYLKAPNAGDSDNFGGKISINGDVIVVGVASEDSAQTTITNGTKAAFDDGTSGSGAAYVFKRSGTTWSQEAYLKAPNAGNSDGFGGSVAVSGNTIVVGAGSEDSAQTTITSGTTAASDDGASGAGAAYIILR